MKLQVKIALVTGALALSATPALAHGKPETVPPSGHGEAANEHANGGQGNGPDYQPEDPTPGPKAGLPEKAKAYGRHCQGESRKHVKGEKGTPFSQCVTAMARAANNEKLTPGQACKGMSKKHVKGQKGTPFSQCVTGAAQMRREEHREEQGA
ncbi:MAG: hypothetical protein ACREL3_01315 [Gemmatimonadales bacterium]